MKKFEMMKGLLAGRQHLALGGQPQFTLQSGDPNPASIQGQVAGMANNPYASSTGLQMPSGTGQQFQTGGVDQGMFAPGAQQGVAQQQALSGQLMQQAQGQGPNPAKALLAQATGQNVAQTGSLMAGQRGASANPALIAKQAAMAGANLQQNAAGQAATLGAEQQLAAQSQLANLSQQQNAQQLAANQQNIQQQGSINQLIQQQQAARAGLLGGAQQGAGAAAAIRGQGTGTGQTGTSLSGFTGTDSQMDQNYQNSANSMTQGGGGINGAQGGQVGPRSFLGQHLSRLAMGGYAKGGKVPAMVSPGEIYLPPKKAKEVAKGKASPMEGQRIPGKAKVPGDSLKNDTVKKTLEEGGVVIKRTAAQDADKAAAFVRAVMAKKKVR